MACENCDGYADANGTLWCPVCHPPEAAPAAFLGGAESMRKLAKDAWQEGYQTACTHRGRTWEQSGTKKRLDELTGGARC
jgi:hypothetical protein